MSNGMSPRIRHLVAGLAAIATTGLLVSTLVNSFDTRLIQGPQALQPTSAVVAAVRRDLIRKA
jgi:hypothetical protein